MNDELEIERYKNFIISIDRIVIAERKNDQGKFDILSFISTPKLDEDSKRLLRQELSSYINSNFDIVINGMLDSVIDFLKQRKASLLTKLDMKKQEVTQFDPDKLRPKVI